MINSSLGQVYLTNDVKFCFDRINGIVEIPNWKTIDDTGINGSRGDFILSLNWLSEFKKTIRFCIQDEHFVRFLGKASFFFY